MKEHQQIEKVKSLYENKLNWDNEFIVRFRLENNKTLKYIPNNIFSVDLPKITITDLSELDVNKTMRITLRSSYDGSVENEIFDTLLRTSFDIDVSLSNPNVVAWQYNSCSIEDIEFTPLVDRKSKANPLNIILTVKISQIVYTGSGNGESIEFGDRIPNIEEVDKQSAMKGANTSLKNEIKASETNSEKE